MPALDLLGWIIIGLLAGGISGWFVGTKSVQGCLPTMVVGILGALWFAWRWSKSKKTRAASQAAGSSEAQSAFLAGNFAVPDLEDTSARAELLRERARLRSELDELDFDFQSGKLSENDYQALKGEIENKGALVMQQLAALPP